MKRSMSSLLIAAILSVGTAAVVLFASSDARAEHYRPPPPGWVARYKPVYYHGYPHYYYGGHWGYYRPGYGWSYYGTAPRELCHYRGDYYGEVRVVCD